jgi:hypothetical protein
MWYKPLSTDNPDQVLDKNNCFNGNMIYSRTGIASRDTSNTIYEGSIRYSKKWIAVSQRFHETFEAYITD